MDQERLVAWILRVTVVTLALIVTTTVGVLLYGLFNERISNDQIFQMLSPAFNTVVGAFVGLLGGLSLNRAPRSQDNTGE